MLWKGRFCRLGPPWEIFGRKSSGRFLRGLLLISAQPRIRAAPCQHYWSAYWLCRVTLFMRSVDSFNKMHHTSDGKFHEKTNRAPRGKQTCPQEKERSLCGLVYYHLVLASKSKGRKIGFTALLTRVKGNFKYSYFEKGCRKKCARENPER